MARDYKKIVDEAYKRVMVGESLRSISESLGVDKKTLRAKMKEYLDTKQNEEMDARLKVGRKKNPNSKLTIPQGKKKSKNLDKELKFLADSGITPEQIEVVFEKMKLNRATKITRETFVYKLLEILQLIEKRNNGINPKSRGFISTDDIVKMILANPRIMSIDSNRRLGELFKLFDDEANLTVESTNRFLKSNPLVLNNGINKLRQEMIILRQFGIREKAYDKEDTNLLQYCLSEGGKIFQVNSQKLFHRLCYFASKNNGSTINPIQYKSLNRKQFKQGLNNSTDETLENRYVLPNQDDQFEANVQSIIDDAIRQRLM